MSNIEKKIHSIICDLAKIMDVLRDGKTPVDHGSLPKRIRSVVKRVKALPVEQSVAMVFLSPMRRTRQTLKMVREASLQEAFAPAAIETCRHIREIALSPKLSLHVAKEVAKAAQDGHYDFSRLVPVGTRIRRDTPEERKNLATLTTRYEGGETVSDYAQRILQGYTALLLKAGGKGEGRKLPAIAATIPPASREQIEHILFVQNYLKAHKALPDNAYDPNLVYAPLAKAVEGLPEGTRLVTCRHADTDWANRGLLTGGSVNVPLNARGKKVATVVGALTCLLRGLNPSPHEVLIVGHSGGNALKNAALCTVSPDIVQLTDGSFSPHTPHIADKRGGKISIRELTTDYLKQLHAITSPSHPSPQSARPGQTSSDASLALT